MAREKFRAQPKIGPDGRPLIPRHVPVTEKSFLQRFLDHPTVPKQRLFGTLGAHAAAVAAGADIVRVHDVTPTRDALAIWQALVAGETSPRKAAAKKAALWDED